MAKKTYVIMVETNPGYTGIDAGNVAFANGKATITDSRMAEWFREHDGYSVKEIVEDNAQDVAPAEPSEKKVSKKDKAE